VGYLVEDLIEQLLDLTESDLAVASYNAVNGSYMEVSFNKWVFHVGQFLEPLGPGLLVQDLDCDSVR